VTPGAQDTAAIPVEAHMGDEDFDGMVISRVVITRVMSDDDIVDHVIAATADGDELGLAEALGMMRLAEDTLIRSRQDAE
jgi:hypothetical protein